MFEEIKEKFYESLIESIKDRKKSLEVIRDDILPDPKRVTKILNIIRDAHHPYLIGRDEYPRLIYLFRCKNKDLFDKEDILNVEVKTLREKCGNNYDEMLWEHIDWDKMFQDVITELSKFVISEEAKKLKELKEQKELKKLEEQKKLVKLAVIFENALVDYVPYAAVKNEGLHPNYVKVCIFDDERERKRQDAIKWVYLRHGSSVFKQTFYKRFSGKTLHEFDKEFHEFVLDYLEEKNTKDYSLGKQTYSFHKSFSRIIIHWQELPEVKYGDVSDEKSDMYILLDEYRKYGMEHMKKLEEYQREFDKLHIDIE